MQDEQQQPDQGWIWLPWTQKSSFKAFPGSNSLRISMGRSSSHFCDLEVDGEDEHNSMYFDCQSGQDLEKNQQHAVCEVNPNKQLPKPAPKKHNDRLSVILLDQGLFTVYKRLFLVCLALNVTGLMRTLDGYFPHAKQKPALFSIGNILALTLCRSEAFLRLVFWLAVKSFGRP